MDSQKPYSTKRPVTKRPITKRSMLKKVHTLSETTVMFDFFSRKFATFLLKVLKVSFLESRAAARSSNTFHLNFHFKENTWRRYSAFSFEVTSKSYENKFLHFDLEILKIFFLFNETFLT